MLAKVGIHLSAYKVEEAYKVSQEVLRRGTARQEENEDISLIFCCCCCGKFMFAFYGESSIIKLVGKIMSKEFVRFYGLLLCGGVGWVAGGYRRKASLRRASLNALGLGTRLRVRF